MPTPATSSNLPDDPLKWFPVTMPGEGSKTAAPVAVPTAAPKLPDDPLKWFPVTMPGEATAPPAGKESPFPPPTPTLPSRVSNDPGGAIPRIAEAFKEGYYGSPNLLSDPAHRWVEGLGPVITSAVDLPETALAVVGGVARAGQQLVQEVGSDINPLLGRDLAAMPEALAGSPNAIAGPWTQPPMPGRLPSGPYTAPGLNLLAGGVEPVPWDITQAAVEQKGPTSPVPQLRPEAPPPGVAPTTVAQAKAIAGAHYDLAPASDSGLTPQFNQKLLDQISPPRETESLVGKNDVTDLLQKLEARKDQPLSMRGVQEQDEDIGDLIEKHRDAVTGKLDKEGQQLDEIQNQYRKAIMDADAGDTSGGPEGFEALKNGRIAWSQAMKMSDVQRMWDKSFGGPGVGVGRDVPTTSFKQRVNTYLNSGKSVGWTPEERASLTDAADRGFVGGVMHTLGSRLLATIAGAAAGTKYGIPGIVAGEAIAHAGGAGLRAVGNALAERRFQNTMTLLGTRVPPSPLLPQLSPLNPPPANPLQP